MTGSFPSDPSGLATGAALAYGAADRGPVAHVQGSLFGVDPIEPDGVGELVEIAPAPRDRGLPAGSRNRSTEDWSRFLLTRFRSLLIGLAELAQATPLDLQDELGGAPGGETRPRAVRWSRWCGSLWRRSRCLRPTCARNSPWPSTAAALA